jgi:enamine deaminase RidA (YjgF/YER057c/UK114 family)
LKAAGCAFDDVMDVIVFIVDPEKNFEKAWKIVPEYWGGDASHSRCNPPNLSRQETRSVDSLDGRFDTSMHAVLRS